MGPVSLLVLMPQAWQESRRPLRERRLEAGARTWGYEVLSLKPLTLPSHGNVMKEGWLQEVEEV